MNRPLVSVVIPCYNAVRFVRETLESVFKQTWSNVETVVVDDGSGDGTSELLDGMRASGAKFSLIRQSRGGASAARNRGTAAASGEYIQYLDADDLLTEDSIERKVAAAEASDADVIYTDWKKLVEDRAGNYVSGETVSRSIEEVHPSSEIAIFTSFWAPPAALLYRRRIVEKIGGWRESVPVIQDARFLLDAAFAGASFVRVPAVSAVYRVHRGGSLSTHDGRRFSADVYAQALEVRDLWKSRGVLSGERKEALMEVFGYLARYAFQCDPELYVRVRGSIHEIEPRYVPRKPLHLRYASMILGYDNAERLALFYRRLLGRGKELS